VKIGKIGTPFCRDLRDRLHDLHSCNIPVRSIRTDLQSPVLRQKRRSRVLTVRERMNRLGYREWAECLLL